MPTPPAGSHARVPLRAKNPLLLSLHLLPLPAAWLPTPVASLPLALRTPMLALPAQTPLASAVAAPISTGDMLPPSGAAPHASVQRAAAPTPKTLRVVTASAMAAVTAVAAATKAATVTAGMTVTAAAPVAPSTEPKTASLAAGGACLSPVFLGGGGALVPLARRTPAATESETLAGAVSPGGVEQRVLRPRLARQAPRPERAVAMPATLAADALSTLCQRLSPRTPFRLMTRLFLCAQPLPPASLV